MTVQKINLKALEWENLSKAKQKDEARKLITKLWRTNINQPETELVFARQVRTAIQDGSFNMADLEEDLLEAWTVKAPRYGDDNYWRTRMTFFTIEAALQDLYHFELAKRFTTFAKKAIAESKKLEAETARRKKAVA